MKALKFRFIRRWSNGDKFVPGSVGGGKTSRMIAYWFRVNQAGTFIKPKRKPKKQPA